MKLPKDFDDDPIINILIDAIGVNPTIECIIDESRAFRDNYIIGDTRGRMRSYFDIFVTKRQKKEFDELPYNKLDARLEDMTQDLTKELTWE